MNKELEKLLQRVWEAARTTYEQDAMGNYVESTISEPFFDNLHTWIESEKMAPSTGIAAIIDSFDAAFTEEDKDKGTVSRLNEVLECFDEGGVPNLNWVHKKLIALKAAIPANKEEFIPEVVNCPHCGSDDIYTDAFEPEGCYVPVGCNSCDHEWRDTYKYTGIEEVSQVTSF